MPSSLERARSVEAGVSLLLALCNLACEQAEAPPAPEGLRIASVSFSSVDLAWNAVAGGHGYEVAVLQPGEDWRSLGTVKADDVEEPVNGLEPGTRYAFRLRTAGEYKGLESAWSEAVVVRTLSLPSITAKKVSTGTSPFADGEQTIQSIAAWYDADHDGVFRRAFLDGTQGGEDAVYPRYSDAGCRARDGHRFAPGANVIVTAEIEHRIDPSQHQFVSAHLRVEDGSVTGAAVFGGDARRVQREGDPARVDLAYFALPTARTPGRLTGTITATLAATACSSSPAVRLDLDVDVPIAIE